MCAYLEYRYICVHTSMEVGRHPNRDLLTSSEKGSLPGLELTKSASLADEQASDYPPAGLGCWCVSMHSSLCGFWESNSGPCAFNASTLLRRHLPNSDACLSHRLLQALDQPCGVWLVGDGFLCQLFISCEGVSRAPQGSAQALFIVW